MFEQLSLMAHRAGMMAAVAGMVFCSAIAHAAPGNSADDKSIGKINFDEAKLPPANVELDLSQEMIGNLFGISDAAIAGVAETLSASAKGDSGEGMRMASEQLAAVRKIIGLSSKVVREVRIRAYEKLSDDLSSRFDEQLREGNWEKVVVLRKGSENARVYVIYRGDSIRGAFVVAAGNGGQVLVNVVCDISPDNVKNLTSAATKIGLDNGLQREIERKFQKMQGARSPASPQPPRAPQLPKSDAA